MQAVSIHLVDVAHGVVDQQRCAAVNSNGFEVDILRREAQEQDPHPARLSDAEDDFSAVTVGTSGHMARMNTVHPLAFVGFKRWLAKRPDRDPLKSSRDALQADTVEQLVRDYLPQLAGELRAEAARPLS